MNENLLNLFITFINTIFEFKFLSISIFEWLMGATIFILVFKILGVIGKDD